NPNVTGVGGTTLNSGTAGAYVSETTWNDASSRQGGGGGISSVWAIPSYQVGFGTTTNKGSTAKRMVPDVSLDSDGNTGYSILYRGQWYLAAGTSAAAPLWSAFAALVNQGRAAIGKGTIGQMNATLYAIAKGTRYHT